MCDQCGCHIHDHDHEPPSREIQVLRHLLADNDRQAYHNRQHFDANQVLVINLMSSPGSGKTALLEATIDALAGEMAVAVIEGDLATDRDARRIQAKGVPAVQITTGTACHLDARMVHLAFDRLNLSRIDLLFIENVGNLVCPASFDLGQHHNVVLLAVTEGDDKPAKYPVIFRSADLVLITKTDLLPYLDDFDPAQAESYLRHLANPAPVLALSARTGVGLDGWLEWLRREQRRFAGG